mgnify:CR=1 FL=1
MGEIRGSVIVTVFLAILPLWAASSDEEAIRLPEVVVEPEMGFRMSTEPALPGEISKEFAEELPLIDNDVYRAAQIFPGVVSTDFSARFHVRGGDLDEVGVRLDGVPIYQPYHLQDFGGAISTIDLKLVERTKLLTGGYPPEYGDWLSAVYDIRTRSAPPPSKRIELGLDLLNTHLILDSKLPWGSDTHWLFAARRGYIDLLMKVIESEEKFEPRYLDVFNKLELNVSPETRLSINALYALDTNLIDEPGVEEDVESRYENASVWCRLVSRLSEGISLETAIFGGGFDGWKREGVGNRDDRRIWFGGAKVDLSAALGIHRLKGGLEARWGSGDYDYLHAEEKGVTSVKAELSGYLLRAYLQDGLGLGRLRLNAGLGWWYQSRGGRMAISPRLSASLKLTDSLTLNGAWGLFRQPITVTELPVEEGISDVREPQRATHYILGLVYSPTPRVLVKVEGYRKEMRDLAGRIEDYGRKERFFIRAESGYAHGVELFWSQALSDKLFLMLGYTWSVAKARGEGKEFYRPFDQRHTLGVNLNYRMRYGVLNLTWRFHTGNPYTESWYERVEGEWVKRYGEPYAARLPSYHSLDVRFTRRMSFGWGDLSFYVQVLNLYNRANVHEYSWVRSGDRYERIEEHYLPITPTFGIEVSIK